MMNEGDQENVYPTPNDNVVPNTLEPTYQQQYQPEEIYSTDDNIFRQQQTTQTTQTGGLLSKITSFQPPIQHSHPRLFMFISLLATFTFIFIPTFIWLLISPMTMYPFFIFPTWIGILFITIFYLVGSPKWEGKEKAYIVHFAFWLICCIFFFMFNMVTTRYPFSIWPITVLTIPFGIHTLWHFYRDTYFGSISIHLLIYTLIQINLFITWCFGYSFIPWFIFPLIGWGLLLIIHIAVVKILQKRKGSTQYQQSQQPVTQTRKYQTLS